MYFAEIKTARPIGDIFLVSQPSAKAKDKEDAKALGVHRVPENQKREVYERVRRAVDAKAGICTSHKVGGGGGNC